MSVEIEKTENQETRKPEGSVSSSDRQHLVIKAI